MFYVYVIQSEKSGLFYIGMTSNVENRLKEHNYGLVKSTKAYIPYRLIHTETFITKTEAIKRELEIKHKGQEKEKIIQKVSSYNRRFPPTADQP